MKEALKKNRRIICDAILMLALISSYAYSRHTLNSPEAKAALAKESDPCRN